MKKIINTILRLYLKTTLKLGVKNKNVVILSNNCWAGHIYQDLGVGYLSPTAGLYFVASDYIKFLSNLDHYLNCNLSFITVSKHESERDKVEQRGNIPIGVLDDIEIHFLHYKNADEAKAKWVRRCSRMSKSDIFVKMDDQNGCKYEDILAFDRLPYANKVFFSSHNYPRINSLVYLPYYKKMNVVGNLHGEIWSFIFRFNIKKWLNKK